MRTLTDARVRARAGMDDTLLSLVSSLVRVQTLLMDSRFANFWTSMAVKRQLATSLPNLADLCTAALARWLDVQKGKVEGIRERSARIGRWEQEEADAADTDARGPFVPLSLTHSLFFSNVRVRVRFVFIPPPAAVF